MKLLLIIFTALAASPFFFITSQEDPLNKINVLVSLEKNKDGTDCEMATTIGYLEKRDAISIVKKGTLLDQSVDYYEPYSHYNEKVTLAFAQENTILNKFQQHLDKSEKYYPKSEIVFTLSAPPQARAQFFNPLFEKCKIFKTNLGAYNPLKGNTSSRPSLLGWINPWYNYSERKSNEVIEIALKVEPVVPLADNGQNQVHRTAVIDSLYNVEFLVGLATTPNLKIKNNDKTYTFSSAPQILYEKCRIHTIKNISQKDLNNLVQDRLPFLLNSSKEFIYKELSKKPYLQLHSSITGTVPQAEMKAEEKPPVTYTDKGPIKPVICESNTQRFYENLNEETNKFIGSFTKWKWLYFGTPYVIRTGILAGATAFGYLAYKKLSK